jgi:hypothetical protein
VYLWARRPKRTRLRKQALDWLRADLADLTKLADDAKEHARIRQMLQHWLRDTDLAAIRDPEPSPSCCPRSEKRARNFGPTWRRC